MTTLLNFEVNMDSLMEIESALNMQKDKSKIVLKTAINDTAKKTFNLLIKEAAKKYAIKDKKAIEKTLTLDKATTRNLTAKITSKGRVNELYNFVVNPNVYVRGGGVPGGYKGRVLKGTRGKKLVLKPKADGDEYKAFIVRYKSGHMTVGQRVPGKKMKSNPNKEFVKSLLSPSVPTMLGGPVGVYNLVQPQIYSMLQENIQKQMKRYLG